ncbi:MAG: type 4a pilus biogenesis protein PilO [Polyangiales bacterium]
MAAAAAAAASKSRQIGTPIKLGAGFVVFILIAAGYYLFLYADLANAVKAAKDKYAQLQSDDIAAQEAFKAYTADSNKLEEKKAKSREFNKQLPETTEMAAYLTAINQQAEIAGLKVRSIFPMDEAPQPFYTRVPVRLDVKGRYHQIAKFFYGISRLDRIVNVENIEMGTPKMGEDEQTVLTASCLTTTFHANKPVGAAAGGPKK